ncbi:hypothetical protein [Tenacibaculum jejuense]|uniref:Uncharacterized protein n=1 Tax=Tenacibaculum jejuense TaxID=584609 RepID=A0A238U6F3_9FLAO|nr:hypothetical protein [Tenacibaculum jejuense]SNR14168.1 protein of unknown function [Tenacibaculum jejuense]
MAHTNNGIITSFKYDGELLNVILVGNYCLIPFKNKYGTNYSDSVLEPYEELTKETRKILKELSFKGKCAYIETDYFGGPGSQISEVWFNGERMIGPLISFDGIENPKIPLGAILVENSINESLKTIGVYRHEEKDEFDSLRLGSYRSNDEIIEEYKKTQSNKV